MSPKDAKNIAELANEIVRHKRLYYSGNPEISDEDFDRLEASLRSLAPDHPALQYVGSDESLGSDKVPHATPMLSLQKVYDTADLLNWWGDEVLVGSYKIDGNSLSLVYRDDKLVLAKTRGNGSFGENVTDKVRWVADVPTTIAGAGDLEIRGELSCSEEQFARLVDEMLERGLERPTSPRNIVAGMMGRKTNFDLSRYFSFIAFDLLDDGALGFGKEQEKVAWLARHGFTLPFPQVITDLPALTAYLDEVKTYMSTGSLGIDGAVFVYDDLAKQAALGNTSHHPRYKMSFKWQGATALAVIQSFTWQTSRHGIVTPVAVIDPVELSGARITNVTLHNAQFLKTFALKPGDTIEIVRSGEVIPKFLRVTKAVAGEHAWLESCPSCQAKLEFDDVRLRCPNTEACPAQHMGGILNWIRYAEIDDLSEKRLEVMLTSGLVQSVPDLYRLTVADLLTLPLTKQKMAEKLFANIQRTKSMPLKRFLAGLGVPGMGLTSWEKLVAELGDLPAILGANPEQIAAIEGFAEKTSQQVFASLQAKVPLVRDLLAVGVEPQAEQPVVGASQALAGRQIAITGKLSQPRSEVAAAIKRAGGKVASSVSKNTYAVVTDDPASGSSKMTKARELGVLVWSEEDLAAALAAAES